MKGAIYTRYSTTNQTQNSTETQVNTCVEYCNNNNIDVEFIFSDEEHTGFYDNRNQFQNLLKVAKAKLIECVVVYDLTRGSREVADWFNFRKQMRSLNIKVISATEKLGDIFNPDDFLKELIQVGMGEHSILQTRQKSIDAKYTKARHGVFLGGFAPLGYDIVNQQYVINEREAEVVRRIFELYVQGHTYKQILEEIKKYGVTGKKGQPISMSTLNGLLSNPRYMGRYIWMENINREMHQWVGKKNDKAVIIENAIPAIIDKETFELAQNRLKSRQIRSSHNAKRDYLLSNKLFCGECGQLMRGSTITNGKKKVVTSSYVCKGKRELKSCDAPNISAVTIEETVKEAMKQWVTQFNINKIKNFLAEKSKAKIDTSTYEIELKEVLNKKKNIIDAVANGLYCPEMNEQLAELRDTEEFLKKKINCSQNNNEVDLDKINKKIKSLIKDLDKNIDPLVREFVKCVIAHKDGHLDIYVGIHTSQEGRISNWLPK